MPVVKAECPPSEVSKQAAGRCDMRTVASCLVVRGVSANEFSGHGREKIEDRVRSRRSCHAIDANNERSTFAARIFLLYPALAVIRLKI